MKTKYISYLRGILFPLVFLTFPFALVQQFIFEEATQLEDKITLGTIGVILGFVEWLLVTTMLGYGIQKNQPIGKYYRKHFKSISIEVCRGLGSTAVGFLMFIVPGIIRMVRYVLVPFIVQFDLNYQDGKIDALEEAKDLLKDRFFKFFTLVFLTQLAIVVVQISSVKFNLFTTPLAWILFYLIEVILQTAVFWVYYNYYQKLKTDRIN